MADEGISPEAYELIQKRLHADYKWLSAQVQGKRILRHLYVRCGQGDSSFVPGHPDGTAFKEGGRAVWLEIETHLRWTTQKREEFLSEAEEWNPLKG